MHFFKNFRAPFLQIAIAVLLVAALLLPAPAFSLDQSQTLMSGFNAYLRKDYESAIKELSQLVNNNPDPSFRDLAIFWLAKANCKAGRRQEAAKYIKQFLREYPDSPLKGTLGPDLLALAESDAQHAQAQGTPECTAKAPVQGQDAARTAPSTATAPAEVAPELVAAEKAAAEEKAAAAEKSADADTPAAVGKTTPEKPAGTSSQASAAKQVQSVAFRNKAIEGYKAVIDKFPATAAASSASAMLNQLGVEYPLSPRSTAASPRQEAVSQVFNLEVAPFADLDVRLGPASESQEVGRPFYISFEVENTGNGVDSFYLESGFPSEFDFHFTDISAPGTRINRTPQLAVGERFKGVAVGTMPRSYIDGQRSAYTLKVVSALDRDVSLSRDIVLLAAAPVLRALVKNETATLLPGEKTSYRVSLVNIGTAAARGVALRLSYPPQYEPTSLPAGAMQKTKGAVELDGLQLKSGESTDFTLTFQLTEEALADQELLLRADLVNCDLDRTESYVSPTTVVQRVSGVTARTASEKIVVIPGETVTIPVLVTNTGNVWETFAIKAKAPANVSYTFFADLNRDGKRQPSDPTITSVGPLSPKEERYVALELITPVSGTDGALVPVSVFLEPEDPAARATSVNLQVSYSRPVLQLAISSKAGKLKPGEISSLELSCVNQGSSLAKQVVMQSVFPAQLEVVASDPAFAKGENGVLTWHFNELGTGERRNIKVTFRVKPGIGVGTNMQLRNAISYQDQLGNRY